MIVFRYCTAAVLAAVFSASTAHAQNFADKDLLPDAPSFSMRAMNASLEAAQPEALQGPATPPPAGQPQGTAQVDGTVLDSNGNPVPGATVILAAPGKLGDRTTTAGDDGTFRFVGVPAGEFRLIVNASGLDSFDSPPFAVRAASTVQAPRIGMKVSTSTSVSVVASPDQIALEQVHEQEQQRVLGVFQNFYTSYIWNAAPMPTKQKYKLAVRAFVDPFQFLIVAGVAGAEHFNGTYPGYGPGIEGYGKRYGAALADSFTSRFVGSAVLPSLLHQDPRYFYQGSGSVGSRTWHALSSTLVCRGDNGKLQPGYSHILGSLTAGAVANAYHPESSRGLGLTFETLGITTGANAIGNLIREFVLRGLVPSVPDYAKGK